HEEAWGRRRLAYPIQKFNEGNYHLFVFESEGSLAELDRRMKHSDRILRHMIVRTDLAHKRAEKLAKKNPKKERVRPATAFAATGCGLGAGRARRGSGRGAGGRGCGGAKEKTAGTDGPSWSRTGWWRRRRGRRRITGRQEEFLLPPQARVQVLRGEDRVHRLQ